MKPASSSPSNVAMDLGVTPLFVANTDVCLREMREYLRSAGGCEVAVVGPRDWDLVVHRNWIL